MNCVIFCKSYFFRVTKIIFLSINSLGSSKVKKVNNEFNKCFTIALLEGIKHFFSGGHSGQVHLDIQNLSSFIL